MSRGEKFKKDVSNMINNLKVLTIYLHHQRIRIIVLSYILFLEKKEFFYLLAPIFRALTLTCQLALHFNVFVHTVSTNTSKYKHRDNSEIDRKVKQLLNEHCLRQV